MYNPVKHENIELRDKIMKFFTANEDKYFDITYLAKYFNVSIDKMRINLNKLVKINFLEKDNFLGTKVYTYRG